jgi:hypothetical protein
MTTRKTDNDESKATADSFASLRNDKLEKQATAKARQLQIPSLHCGMTTRKTGNNNGQGDDWVEGLAGISQDAGEDGVYVG